MLWLRSSANKWPAPVFMSAVAGRAVQALEQLRAGADLRQVHLVPIDGRHTLGNAAGLAALGRHGRQMGEAGVMVAQPAAYRLQHPAPAGLRLGFAAFSEAGIRGGVLKLAWRWSAAESG